MITQHSSESSIQQAHAELSELRAQIGKVLIGQHEMLDFALTCLIAPGHALIEGVPGLGKTLLVLALSQAIGGKSSRIQFTPDLMPADITGHSLFDIKTQEWRVRRGPVFCNLLLADEINRAPAKTQSALLEVMQEQQVTIEGKSFKLDSPFVTLATQNPLEQEGTYPLPEAQLDRFLLHIAIDYPSEQDELALSKLVTQGRSGHQFDISSIEPCLSPERILEIQQIVANLQMDEQIINYAVRIVRKTRSWTGIEVGAGPRGSISLLRAARAWALLQGNHFVTPDDVKAIAPSVLRHRLRLSTDLEIEGYQVDQVIADMLAQVDAPRQ